MKERGIIALDIDGTITATKHHLTKAVAQFLNELGKEWDLLFLTGRSFAFTRPILSNLTVPYYLAVQNGAALYEESGEKILSKHYISMKCLSEIEKIIHAEKSGLLLDSGELDYDRVFYKPKEFTESELAYIDYRKSFSPEIWVACEEFTTLSLDEFALGKVLTSKEQAIAIHQKLNEKLSGWVHSIVLKDPFRPQGYIVHINSLEASKKEALSSLKRKMGTTGRIISAGDDLNDYGMLLISDVKVVMETAPEVLQKIADIIAPSANEDGIIEGITKAIKYEK